MLVSEDDESGADFLRSLGVTEPYITHFWGFLSHAILNVPVEDCGQVGLWFWYRVICGHRGAHSPCAQHFGHPNTLAQSLIQPPGVIDPANS